LPLCPVLCPPRTTCYAACAVSASVVHGFGAGLRVAGALVGVPHGLRLRMDIAARVGEIALPGQLGYRAMPLISSVLGLVNPSLPNAIP